MKGWLRRIRGAIGMGLTWGAAWFGAGMVMLVTLLLTTGSTGADVPYPLGFGALGFIAGVTFSGVLGLAEGRRRFDQMSLPRFAGWGAAGGFLLSAIFVTAVALLDDPAFLQNLLFLGPIFAVAGSGSAAGSLILARRAEDRTLSDSGGDVSEVGLSDGEVRSCWEAEFKGSREQPYARRFPFSACIVAADHPVPHFSGHLTLVAIRRTLTN